MSDFDSDDGGALMDHEDDDQPLDEDEQAQDDEGENAPAANGGVEVRLTAANNPADSAHGADGGYSKGPADDHSIYDQIRASQAPRYSSTAD